MIVLCSSITGTRLLPLTSSTFRSTSSNFVLWLFPAPSSSSTRVILLVAGSYCKTMSYFLFKAS